MQRNTAHRSMFVYATLQRLTPFGGGLRALLQATTGACCVEYGLLIGLVSAGCAVASAALGQSLAHCFALVDFGSLQQVTLPVGGF